MISFFQSTVRSITFLLVLTLSWSANSSAASVSGYAWQNSASFLQTLPPKVSTTEYQWLNQVQAVFIRALQSPDQARDLITLHNGMGTKAQASYPAYVGPLRSGPEGSRGPEVRQGVLKSVRLYAQKETKLNIFPSAWRDGLRFNFGASMPANAAGSGVTGNPNLRYGLVLTDIEPNHNSVKLASLSSDDYAMWQYAPKAKIHYRVGEVLPEVADYQVVLMPPAKLEMFNFWSLWPAMPSYKFSGRIAPRGLPGAGSPLPPQSILLEQSQGYYQLEAQVSGGFKQEAVIHRFRVPIYAQFSAKQERNKEFRLVKTVYENIYANDHGFALNLERLYLEKRYQLGLSRQQAKAKIELYAHFPDGPGASNPSWEKTRLETRFDFCF